MNPEITTLSERVMKDSGDKEGKEEGEAHREEDKTQKEEDSMICEPCGPVSMEDQCDEGRKR